MNEVHIELLMAWSKLIVIRLVDVALAVKCNSSFLKDGLWIYVTLPYQEDIDNK